MGPSRVPMTRRCMLPHQASGSNKRGGEVARKIQRLGWENRRRLECRGASISRSHGAGSIERPRMTRDRVEKKGNRACTGPRQEENVVGGAASDAGWKAQADALLVPAACP